MTTTTDGRIARRERNRTAVLDAVVELFANGALNPAVDDVSERSGVSTRSVYRYFNHRDRLVREAMRHHRARIESEVQLADIGLGALDERIDRFISHRVRLYLEVAPLTRAVKRSTQVELATDADFEAEREALRTQFLGQFAAELAHLDDREVRHAVTLAELPFQFEAIDYLYRVCEQDAQEMSVMLRHVLTLHFAALAA